VIALGVDQAARSGWGIGRDRQVLHSGVATTHAERKAVAHLALELAGGDVKQLLVVFEDHSGMPLGRLTHADRNTPRKGRQAAPQRNTATILGMGAARGRWEAVLDELGHPKTLRDDVEPRVWRAKLGIRPMTPDQLQAWCTLHGVRAQDADPWKAAACVWASAHRGCAISDPDEGDGGCITAFASIDGLQRNDARKTAARVTARGKRSAKKQLELDDLVRAALLKRPA
jgi:hypothetical protein